jgi:rhodanese-related sulfurtransferase
MVTEIDREELKQKLDHPKKFVLIEALPADHFQRLHLPGALNIPPDQIRKQASDLLPKEVEIIVYCAGPAYHASDDAARELSEMGYSNVRRYVGGKKDWLEAGLPVVRNNESRVAA